MTQNSVVHRDPDILGGVPVFAGTRVPIQTLLDYLAAADTVSTFLDEHPSVTKAQISELLAYFSKGIAQAS